MPDLTDTQAMAAAIGIFLLFSFCCAILFGKFAKAGTGDPVEGIDEERL